MFLKRLYLKPFNFQLDLKHLWCLAVLTGIFAFLNTHPIRPQDFWWHMVVGQEIITTHQIPATDTFSFTMPGAPYPSYKAFWLMDTALYSIYTLGGPTLIVFVHSLTITAAYTILLWLCYRISKNWRIAAACTLFAAALGFNDWNVRPQAVAFPIAALFLLIIHIYHKQGKNKWISIFPLGILIWVNSHGTYPLGLLLLGLWITDEIWQTLKDNITKNIPWNWARLKAPTAALLITSLTCLLNPKGIKIMTYLNTMSGNAIIQNMVPEWAPPSFNTMGGALFLIGFLLSTTILAISPKRPNISELLTFLAFGGLSLRTSRGIIWFGITMAPVLARHTQATTTQIAQWLPQKQTTRSQKKIQRIMNSSLALCLLLGALLSLPWFKACLPLPPEKAPIISSETPIEATAFLQQNPQPGQLFHAMSFGSYLIWATQPNYPVFVDSRIELYPLEIWREYIKISNADCGWEQLLDKYHVQTLFLSIQDQPNLINATKFHPSWERIYEDDHAIILKKRIILE